MPQNFDYIKVQKDTLRRLMLGWTKLANFSRFLISTRGIQCRRTFVLYSQQMPDADRIGSLHGHRGRRGQNGPIHSSDIGAISMWDLRELDRVEVTGPSCPASPFCPLSPPPILIKPANFARPLISSEEQSLDARCVVRCN